MDLTAVEGLADLIGAETEAQRRQAFRQMKGLLGDKAESWRGRLIQALALVEARIDFSDEADVPEDLIGPALEIVRGLVAEIDEALAGAARGERLRDGLVVAIAGPPNAGKSTLLNRMVRREAAIVSPVPGTTRDVIEVHLDLDGYPVTLLDTAGVRDSDDPVEQEGVRRARERAAEADLVLWVTDAREPVESVSTPPISGPAMWLVRNKADLLPSGAISITECEFSLMFLVSAVTGQGMNEITAAVSKYATDYLGREPGMITRTRHRHALETVRQALNNAVQLSHNSEDLIAEELRLAAQTLGRLTGRIDVEDILDVIFRDFCIGK